MEEHRIRLVNRSYHTEDVMFLDYECAGEFTFEPGQYVTLELTQGDQTRYKPYSIYSHPDETTITFCVKLVDGGFASTYFADAPVGDEVRMRGPLGQFTLDDDLDHHILLATGTGVAPMHSIIHEALQSDENVVELFHGIPTRDDLIDETTFQELDNTHEGFSYTPVFSREDANHEGYVQDHAPIQDNTAYYLCGLKAFVEETTSYLTEHQVSEALINRERFS
jgi:ferredoxin-NADP reductase